MRRLELSEESAQPRSDARGRQYEGDGDEEAAAEEH